MPIRYFENDIHILGVVDSFIALYVWDNMAVVNLMTLLESKPRYCSQTNAFRLIISELTRLIHIDWKFGI